MAIPSAVWERRALGASEFGCGRAEYAGGVTPCPHPEAGLGGGATRFRTFAPGFDRRESGFGSRGIELRSAGSAIPHCRNGFYHAGTPFPHGGIGLHSAGFPFPHREIGFHDAGLSFQHCGIHFHNAGSPIPHRGTGFDNAGFPIPHCKMECSFAGMPIPHGKIEVRLAGMLFPHGQSSHRDRRSGKCFPQRRSGWG